MIRLLCLLSLCTATAFAQNLQPIEWKTAGQEVRAVDAPFIIVSSKENNPPLNPEQLRAAGYVLCHYTDGSSCWVRTVQPGSSSGQASSHSGDIGHTSCKSCGRTIQVQYCPTCPPVQRQPIQAPPSQPVAPIQPQPTGPDYEKLADLIVEKMAGDKRFHGADGQNGINGTNGTNGVDGQPGKDAVVDYDKLRDEVVAKLSLVIQYTDKNRRVVEERPFMFNQANNRFEVQIDPIHVQNFDVNSKLVDEEKYPYGTPIRLKDRVRDYKTLQ